MENEKFSIFAPFRIGKTGAKILSFEESLFWHPGLFTVFPDRYANSNVGLADKKWSKLLIPIARPLSIAKGVWNVPRLRKRWFVDPMVSFILQNAKCIEKIAGNLLFLSSEHLKSIQNDQKFWIFAPKIILHFLDKNNSSKWSEWQNVNKNLRFWLWAYL